MRQLILLCLILLTTTQLHSQTGADISRIPPQVMQLGRGTADTLDWHPSGDVLAVGGSLGLWLYDDSLADLAYFPDAGSVAWISWSPNGDQLASANWDDTLSLWDATLDPYSLTLNRSWTFRDDGYALRCFWSPDGERLAVVTSDGAMILDVDTGETLLTIPDLEFTLTWHPDGTQIAGAIDLGEDIGEQVRVWDAATSATINTYTSADPDLFWSDVQWSPDGSVLVGITVLPATLYAWSLETGDLLSDVDTLAVEFGGYFDMWWLNDGRQLITTSRYVSPPATSVLEIWDTESWTAQDRGFALGNVRSIAKRSNADIWAFLTSDSHIVTWGLEEGEPLQVRSVHGQPPDILEWSPDNQYLAAAKLMGESFNIWDVSIPDQPQSQVAWIPYRGWRLEELRWSADSDKLIGILSIPLITAPGAYPTAFIVEWDTQTGEFLGQVHETPGYVAHDGSGDYLPYYIWSDDFSRVVTEMSDQPIVVSTAGGESGFFSPDEDITTIDIVDYPSEIIWSPDNTMLAIITRDPQGETSAWVHNAETGDLVNRLRPSFPTALYGISWSPDSSMVALVGRRGIAGSGETEYRLDVLEIDPLSDEATHITTVLDIDTFLYHTWHPGSRTIAVTTSLGVGVYSIEPAPMGVEAVPITTIPTGRVFALAWSPDGTWLAGGHEDGTVRVWDVTGVNR